MSCWVILVALMEHEVVMLSGKVILIRDREKVVEVIMKNLCWAYIPAIGRSLTYILSFLLETNRRENWNQIRIITVSNLMNEIHPT